ncbi:MAG: YmdB family metallophosphoesterase [Phycisphaerales bacterium]
MSDLRLAFFGDTVGSLGRRAVAHAIPRLRAERSVRLFFANGENSRNGSGLSPDNYRELLRSGVHAVTLGDHWAKDRQIVPILEDPHEPIARPANLAPGAPGKRFASINEPGLPPLALVTVLGRMYMPFPSDNPFAAVDLAMTEIAAAAPDALVVLEIHGEATSEKQAMAWHALDRHTGGPGPRVVAVVGSHTHVQTADARILDHRLAAITDLGMCGPHRSVIGRDIRATLDSMVRQLPSPLDIASDDNRACGVVVTIDLNGRRASEVEAISVRVPD